MFDRLLNRHVYIVDTIPVDFCNFSSYLAGIYTLTVNPAWIKLERNFTVSVKIIENKLVLVANEITGRELFELVL